MLHPASRIRAGITFGMLPLIFLSGMPLAVCVCASGEQRVFCRGFGLDLFGSSEAEVPECCRQPHESAPSWGGPSCCASQIPVLFESDGNSISGRCCHSATTLPTPTITPKRTALPDDPLPVVFVSTETVRFGEPGASVAQIRDNLDVPPPRDLVILYRVLTI